jgi:hypothetical protein
MVRKVLVVGVGWHRDFGLASLRRAGCIVGVIDDLSKVPVDAVDWCLPYSPAVIDDPVAALKSSPYEWDVITCWDEFAVTEVPRFTSALGIPGPELDAACFRDKSLMRARLREHDLRSVRYVTAGSWAEAVIGVDSVGWPAVVKPVDYSSSSGVTLATGTAELRRAVERALRKSPRGRCIIEEFIDGPEYSVETVTWSVGRHLTLGITEKTVTDLPYFVELEHVFPADLDAGPAAQLVMTVHRALDAFGMERGSSHAEVKLTTDGPVVVEIAGRSGGDLIPRLVFEATGINPYLLEVDAVAAATPPITLPVTSVSANRTSGVRFLQAPPGCNVSWPATDVVRGSVLEHTIIDLQQWHPAYATTPVLDTGSRRLGCCLVSGDRGDVLRSLEQATLLNPVVQGPASE